MPPRMPIVLILMLLVVDLVREGLWRQSSRCARYRQWSFAVIGTRSDRDCGSFDSRLKFLQNVRTRCGVILYPAVVDSLDRRYIQIVPPHAPAFLRNDESRLFQDAKVLHHGGSVESG